MNGLRRLGTRLLALLAPCLLAGELRAHEVRPAYLELTETRAGEFDVLWKTPMRGELRLSLAPEFSGAVEPLGPVTQRRRGDASVQTWRVRAVEPLRGQRLAIAGLSATMTDALARIDFLDGTSFVARLTPQRPEALVPLRPSVFGLAAEYLALGVEHILFGVDHLLFVLALLLISKSLRRLVATVTAFTVAHSITLALAVLGFVHVPGPPVEAVIALSIVLVAVEIVRAESGRPGLAARAPWVVGFVFGLLHGLGFAGALAEVGLPEGRIPFALACFNVGVELGQLGFVVAVLGLLAVLRRTGLAWPAWSRRVPVYAIGGLASFWTLERVASF